VSTVSIIILSLFVSTGVAGALSYPSGQVGQDVSWPNCNNLKFSPAIFGVVGVNGGLSFHPNNCVGEEASLYKNNLSLYVNTGYPGLPLALKFQHYPKDCSDSNLSCLAYNYGYNAGLYSVNYSLDHGVVSNNWWLDVELINSWDTNSYLNRMSLSGETNAIESTLKPDTIGIYSTPTQWSIITNKWKDGSSDWLATGSNFKSVAASGCKTAGFSGGKTILVQFIENVDSDLAC
jgi:hypothetical protein